ncbi:PepSY-associated TM helix domain-containing protein [Comamonas testosteroni]|uniref:PepSY-associated TM helix domain-containing protein n=1 Tax=Comamonas testosteroni TaxID=285 RepID=UPI00389A2771
MWLDTRPWSMAGCSKKFMTNNKIKNQSKRGIRQSMAILHTWTGLLLGWILFSMFLTGTVSYFREEITQWMRPELVQPSRKIDAAAISDTILTKLKEIAPSDRVSQWSITLPEERQSLVSASWRISGQSGRGRGNSAFFDPNSGNQIQPRETRGGDFFYRFHFEFYNIPFPWGRWLAGLAGMFMLVAIISGVITHKKFFSDFFTFREHKGLRSWMDAHIALSVFGLPFHLMITYTGLVALMTLYMPWSALVGINTPNLKAEYEAQTQATLRPLSRSGLSAPLTAVGPLVHQAEARWGPGHVGRVIVMNPGDSSARISLSRSVDTRVSTSPETLIFDGVNGQLLERSTAIGPAAQTRGVMYGLHMGRFADVSLRWMYFIVSLAGTAMVGTGLVMWPIKRRPKLHDQKYSDLGFRIVERLNIVAIAGLPLAMAAMLWSNRLLPVTLENRSAWEIRVFFITWLFSLLYAFLRPVKQGWLEQLGLVSCALGILPFISWLTTDRPIWQSIASHSWTFLAVELMFWCFSIIFAVIAIRVSDNTKKIKKHGKSITASRA